MVSEVLSAVADIALEALIGAGKATLKRVFIGSITAITGDIADTLKKTTGILSGVGDVLGTLTTEFGNSLKRIVSDGLGTVSTALQKTLGVYQAQERTFRSITRWVEGQTNAVADYIQQKQDRHQQDIQNVHENITTHLSMSNDSFLREADYRVNYLRSWGVQAMDNLLTYAGEKEEDSAGGPLGFMNQLLGAVHEKLDGMKNSVVDFVKNATDTVGAIVGGFKNAVIDFLDVFIKFILSIITVEPDSVLEIAQNFMGMLMESVRGKTPQEYGTRGA